jgi:hypothetical protein
MFLYSVVSTLVLGINQPPIQWVSVDLCSQVKRLGLEADHSHPSSMEVKKGGAKTRHGLVSTSERDQTRRSL